MKEKQIMSWFDGSYKKEQAIELINTTDKQIMRRQGYAYKGARLERIDKEKAKEILSNTGMIDLFEDGEKITINTYSSNDLY